MYSKGSFIKVSSFHTCTNLYTSGRERVYFLNGIDLEHNTTASYVFVRSIQRTGYIAIRTCLDPFSYVLLCFRSLSVVLQE